MVANVESMFSVREVPWHGLGTIVEEALTSEEALIQSGLKWRVEPKDLFLADGTKVKNAVANVRNTDNSILGVVTEQYKIVQNEEAFNFTDGLLEYDVKYETAGSLARGKKVWLLARMPEQIIIEDKIIPYLVFTNSHDGKGSIRVAITPVRVVCQNTLNLALNDAFRSWSARHMGNIDDKLEEAKRTLMLANEYLNTFKEEADNLVNKKITDEIFNDIVNELFPVVDEDSYRKKSNVEYLKSQLKYSYNNTPDINKFKGSAWGVINAVSDFATHVVPLRRSNAYQENLFDKTIGGHSLIDKTYELLKVA